jgi:acyl carrier protein
MLNLQISAEQFRRKLAGLESPEKKFTDAELDSMKSAGVELIVALRELFGNSLDRKTLWERISNAIPVAAVKSQGKADKFISVLLDYVKAEANGVVGSDLLKAMFMTLSDFSPEKQRQFIRVCVEYRMLLCLEAREQVLRDKEES